MEGFGTHPPPDMLQVILGLGMVKKVHIQGNGGVHQDVLHASNISVTALQICFKLSKGGGESLIVACSIHAFALCAWKIIRVALRPEL
jgi:hypothetical protein